MVARPEPVYVFGIFQLDPGRHLLLRNGEPVSLPPKASAVLQLLVEAGGRLMSKEELLHAIWADSFVDEGTLKQHISILRRALGDDDRYIETVPKLGYRFVAALMSAVRRDARRRSCSSGSRGWSRPSPPAPCQSRPDSG